ncbi:hypothetical protein K2X05_01785 [bacterium]|nr:hypothetical protein [bacterium]
MGIFNLLLIIFIHTVTAQSSSEKEPIPSDWLDQASFSSTVATNPDSNTSRQSIGLLTQNAKGLGLIYKHHLTEKRSLFALVAYKPKENIFLEDFNATSQTGNVDIAENYNYRLLLGIEQTFHLTTNQNWGLLSGVGVGLSQSRYESRLYRPLCNFFICGYDPETFAINSQRDFFGFVNIRLGLTFKVHLWGTVGNVAFAINPDILRTNKKIKFRNIEGQELSVVNTTPLFIEATIGI